MAPGLPKPRAMPRRRSQCPKPGPSSGEVRIDPETQYSFRTPRIAEIQTDGQFKVVWTGPEPLPPEPYPKTRTAEAWRAFLHDLYIGWGNRWAAPHADLPRAKQGH